MFLRAYLLQFFNEKLKARIRKTNTKKNRSGQHT